MAWAGKRHEWFVTAGRDAVINTWSIHEEEASRKGETPKKKKKKKTEKGKGAYIHPRPLGYAG
eukprot:14220719-Ditylum_brightwellii.AAC.1